MNKLLLILPILFFCGCDLRDYQDRYIQERTTLEVMHNKYHQENGFNVPCCYCGTDRTFDNTVITNKTARNNARMVSASVVTAVNTHAMLARK